MSGDPLTYADLQALAEELKRPLQTLYAEANQNDPFMAGTPGREQGARWFVKLWQRFGKPGAHVRHIHYQMVVQATPLLMPNGRPFLNTEACWLILNAASRDARYLGLVPWRDMADHRNGEAVIHFDGAESDAIIEVGGDAEEYAAPNFEIPELSVTAPKIPQPYIIEIWIEKSTMDSIILPIARRYGINVVRGSGETSLTRCGELIDRAVAEDRPVRILYISDFDPAAFRCRSPAPARSSSSRAANTTTLTSNCSPSR